MNAPLLLPSDLSADRAALRAGLAFIEGATGWSEPELSAWFHAHALELGRDTIPRSVTSPPPGTPPPVLPAFCKPRKGKQDPVSRLVAASRWQVIMTLRGLLSTPCDDRFLHAAIFSGRVRRDKASWRLAAREADALHDIVLGLFAVDVLSHREFHQQNLCVCDTCGRISYNPAATTRAGCAEHRPMQDEDTEDVD